MIQFFPEFSDVVSHVLVELLRRCPPRHELAVLVGAILFSDPTTGANEWAVAFSTAAITSSALAVKHTTSLSARTTARTFGDLYGPVPIRIAWTRGATH